MAGPGGVIVGPDMVGLSVATSFPGSYSQQAAGLPIVQFELRRRRLHPPFDVLDALGRRDVFGQGAADALDRVANFLADLFVGLDRLRRVAHALPCQLVASLRHAELVGREFRRVHAVEQVVFLGHGLAALDGITAQTAIQTLVAGIVEDAEHPA